MDEQTLEKNDVLQELLKSEYDLAKHECEYYTQEFNKQDTVYGVYFAVFSVVIRAIYKIAETNNDQLELTNLAVILNQKIIIGGMNRERGGEPRKRYDDKTRKNDNRRLSRQMA